MFVKNWVLPQEPPLSVLTDNNLKFSCKLIQFSCHFLHMKNVFKKRTTQKIARAIGSSAHYRMVYERSYSMIEDKGRDIESSLRLTIISSTIMDRSRYLSSSLASHSRDLCRGKVFLKNMTNKLGMQRAILGFYSKNWWRKCSKSQESGREVPLRQRKLVHLYYIPATLASLTASREIFRMTRRYCIKRPIRYFMLTKLFSHYI